MLSVSLRRLALRRPRSKSHVTFYKDPQSSEMSFKEWGSFLPAIFPDAAGLVLDQQRQAERHNPGAAYHSSSSGCSDEQTPGSSRPPRGLLTLDRR